MWRDENPSLSAMTSKSGLSPEKGLGKRLFKITPSTHAGRVALQPWKNQSKVGRVFCYVMFQTNTNLSQKVRKRENILRVFGPRGQVHFFWHRFSVHCRFLTVYSPEYLCCLFSDCKGEVIKWTQHWSQIRWRKYWVVYVGSVRKNGRLPWRCPEDLGSKCR